MELAPFLTRLDFSDYAYDSDSSTFNDDFFVKMLELTPNLTTLIIGDCDFTGVALEKLSNCKKLKELSISDCPNFNHPLPKKLSNLQHLSIRGCSSFNQSLPIEAPKLERLYLQSCKNFKQPLPKFLPELGDLVIHLEAFNQPLPAELPKLDRVQMECPAYNQPLPEKMPLLRDLSLHFCYEFNQALPVQAPSLERLSFVDCYKFNQPLTNNLLVLDYLRLDNCKAYNQPLPKKLPEINEINFNTCNSFNNTLPLYAPNLKKFYMAGCAIFNQPLPSPLPNLQDFTIHNLPAFNQPFPPELPKLEKLNINTCDNFDQALPLVVPKLESLDIESKSFNLTTKPISNAILYFSLKPKEFEKYFKRISSEKEQLVQRLLSERPRFDDLMRRQPKKLFEILDAFEINGQRFLKDYPNYKLSFINELVKVGKSPDVIEASFLSLKDPKLYPGYLLEALRSFPELSSYLIQNRREQINKDLDDLKISIKTIPLPKRLLLLPLLSPDNIERTMSEVSEGDLIKWSEEPIRYAPLARYTISAALKRFKEFNMTGITPIHSMIIKEFLKTIPLRSLSAFARLDAASPPYDIINGHNTIFAYLPFMDEPQLSVTIPVMNYESFCNYLGELPKETQAQLLFFANFEQKEFRFQGGLLISYEAEKWSDEDKPNLEKQIGMFNADPTKENFIPLEKSWSSTYSSTKFALEKQLIVCDRVKKILMQFNPPEYLKKRLNKEMEQRNKVVRCLEELNQMNQIITVELPKKLTSVEIQIPDEFLDDITGLPMNDPWTDKNGHKCDKSTWDRSKTNPFNRQPIKAGDLTPNTELKTKIEAFKNKNPEIWEKETKEAG